jgi:proteasome lid subunit RPN8/RPN11
VSERERRAVEGPVQGHGAGRETYSVGEPGVRIHPPAGLALPRAAPPKAIGVRWLSPHELQGYPSRVGIFVVRDAVLRLCDHAESDLEREVGGGLAGRVGLEDETGKPFVVVEAAIPGRHTRQGNAFITFTQETLVALHDDIEGLGPETRLVGWYHTHPRMGIFLSGYDRWLHEHFFPELWQVALVMEPHSRMAGFFLRDAGGEMPSREYVGFFEIAEAGSTASADWSNLEREAGSKDAPEEGGVENE